MSVPRRLGDLPGFDAALEAVVAEKAWLNYPQMWEALPNIVLPGVSRVMSSRTLYELALVVDCELWLARRSLRLVPPPRPKPANDCEAP